MKNLLLLLISFFFLTSVGNVNAQNVPFKKQDSEHIKSIFDAWNEKAGSYLYESVASTVMNQQQPERPAGIEKTPYELLQSMHSDRIKRLQRAAETELENEKESIRGKREAYYWQTWIDYLETVNCDMREGSSTGEPHILTFDGERYDFQNAGDYLLSSSEDGKFVVQTQLFRRTTDASWSLNGGVIVNVNGDIIEFRGTKAPVDGEVYINEKLIEERNVTLNLPNGGTIRLNQVEKGNKNRHVRGDRYVVKSPTGEQVRVGIIRNVSFGDNVDTERINVLYQLYVGVPQCKSGYTGLLGNNDGIKNDLVVDTSSINNDRSAYSEEELFGDLRHSKEVIGRHKKSADYIAHTLGDHYQLREKTSLFPIQMTDISDSIRYPQTVVTLASATDEQIANGRKKSEEAGISNDEMYSTIFDNVYANIDPADQVDNPKEPQPEKTDTTKPDLNNEVKPKNPPNPVTPNKPKNPQGTGVKTPPRNPNVRTQPAPRTQTAPSGRTQPPTRTSPGSGTSTGGRTSPGVGRTAPDSGSGTNTNTTRKPTGGR